MSAALQMPAAEGRPVRISAQRGHPWYRPDHARWTVTLHGQTVWGIVHVDTENCIAWGYELIKPGEAAPGGGVRLAVDREGNPLITERRGPFRLEERMTT